MSPTITRAFGVEPSHARTRSSALDLREWSVRPHVVSDEDIARAIAQAGGNRSKAARMLGIDRKTIYRRLERLRRSQMS